MDRRERFSDEQAAIRAAMARLQTRLWTAMPGIVDSFDPVRMVANVQPAITAQLRTPEDIVQDVQMPLLLDCPVVFPGGGGVTLTFALAPGDEVLVVFGSRCIDSWWQQGGVQGQAELRMHNLSDGFAIPGPRSLPRRFNVSTTAAQLRSDDGETYIELQPGGKVRIQATDIEMHARQSWSWDVNGFGERWEHTGGANYTRTRWQTGATVTNVDMPINPPEGP